MESIVDKKKLYHQRFLERNMERIKEKHTCEICFGSYSYFNKYTHEKTKKHQKALEILKRRMMAMEEANKTNKVQEPEKKPDEV